MTTSTITNLVRPARSASLAAALLVVGCSGPGPTVLPGGDGFVAGGGGGQTRSSPPPPEDAAAPPAPPSGGSDGDAGAPPTPPAEDAGARADAGSGADSSPPGVDAAPPAPPPGAGGSCTQPLCGTDLSECGCAATDSNGARVLLGCQAGGQCVCLTNKQAQGQPFPEHGACGDQQSLEAQFLQHCACQ